MSVIIIITMVNPKQNIKYDKLLLFTNSEASRNYAA